LFFAKQTYAYWKRLSINLLIYFIIS